MSSSQALPPQGVRRRRRGGVIVIAGPDGTGKSTLSSALPAAAFGSGPVLHVHHRVRLLPHRDISNIDSTRPHAQQPYPWWLCWAKAAYLFVDHQLAWQVRVRPLIRNGGWVILERGWWDVAVDQRRYRMQSSGWLLRTMGRLLPPPDLVIVLTAPVQTLLDRKAELSATEFERQLRCWDTVLPRRVTRAVIDTTQSAQAVLESAVASVRRVAAAAPQR